MGAQRHKTADRFRDEATYIGEFLDEAWVLCPQCEAFGRVVAARPYWQSEPSFVCTRCFLQLRGRRSRWFGPCHGFAQRPCGRCGRRLEEWVYGFGEVVDRHELACPGCSAVSLAQVGWSFDVGALPYEPAFGLELRLQTECRGHILWAYNPRHLRFLADYAAAKIRERVPNHNASIASRLPSWFKDAKNRSTVLGVIGALERMAAT